MESKKKETKAKCNHIWYPLKKQAIQEEGKTEEKVLWVYCMKCLAQKEI
jgi:hypothetical protein